MTRLFVGTMWCGEGGLDACVEAVGKQANVEITHEVFAFQAERLAHRNLYGAWESVKTRYDAFVQVDADTVLIDRLVLGAMYEQLIAQVPHGKTSIQSPLFDHITRQNIMGLNMYLPVVEWSDPPDLFCDRCSTNNHAFLGPPPRYPVVGSHAEHCTPLQAFRFGVHRGLKGGFGKAYEAVVRAHRDLIKARQGPGGPEDRQGGGPSIQEIAIYGFHVAEQYRDRPFDYVDADFVRSFESVTAEAIREAAAEAIAKKSGWTRSFSRLWGG